jgi:hypothetical protein
VAPEGWWKFRVLGLATSIPDAAGPVIAEVFPNPTSSLLMVTVDGAGAAPVRVTLLDATGREVMLLHNGMLHADRRVFADISYLAEATYLLVVESATGRSVMRVMKR